MLTLYKVFVRPVPCHGCAGGTVDSAEQGAAREGREEVLRLLLARNEGDMVARGVSGGQG